MPISATSQTAATPAGAAAVLALLAAGVPPAPADGQEAVELAGSDRRLDARLAPEYTVGSIDGPEWQLFGGSLDVAFDAAGDLYVFDPQNHRVVAVGPNGDRLRTVGREGGGPGELRNPIGMAVLPDGTVAVADMGHRAFVVYGPGGAHLRSVGFGSGGLVVLGELLPDPGGDAVLSAGIRTLSFSGRGPGAAPALPEGRPIVRYPLREDGEAETLYRGWAPPREPTEAEGGGVRIRMMGRRAFEPELYAGALPGGGLAVSDSSSYAVKVLAPDGTLRRILRRPIRPRPVTEEIRRAERERRLAELEEGGGPEIRVRTSAPGGGSRELPRTRIREMMRQRIEAMGFYPEVPVVTGLATDPAGRVWVARRGEELYGEGPVDLLDPEGSYLGTLAPGEPGVPDAFGPEGLVAFVERDELDVATIRVARLEVEPR